MPKTKQQKEILVRTMSTNISDSPSAVFVGFTNLGIKDEQALRAQLRENGVGYNVTKKSLFKRALAESSYKGQGEDLDLDTSMQFALAYLKDGDGDAVAPAKGIADFAKDKKEKIVILGGTFEGNIIGREKMNEIASIPGRQILLGMFVNVINSPIQGLAVVLDQIAQERQ